MNIYSIKRQIVKFLQVTALIYDKVQFICINEVSLNVDQGWFEVNLDTRKLRTPKGNLFKVPSESLAMAVATEWNSQKDIVKRTSMHLVSSAIFNLF